MDPTDQTSYMLGTLSTLSIVRAALYVSEAWLLGRSRFCTLSLPP